MQVSTEERLPLVACLSAELRRRFAPLTFRPQNFSSLAWPGCFSFKTFRLLVVFFADQKLRTATNRTKKTNGKKLNHRRSFVFWVVFTICPSSLTSFAIIYNGRNVQVAKRLGGETLWESNVQARRETSRRIITVLFWLNLRHLSFFSLYDRLNSELVYQLWSANP